MFCSQCGKEQTQEDSKLCFSCGAPLEAAAAAAGVPPQNSAPVQASGVRPPGMGALVAWLLTAIAGGIFFSFNWKKLGMKQHIWWTMLSSVAVALLVFFSFDLFGNQWAGNYIYIAWLLGMVLLQMRYIPPNVPYSKLWGGTAVLFMVVIALQGHLYSMPNDGSGKGEGDSVIIGSKFDEDSKYLVVTGREYKINQTLYARVYSHQVFDTTRIKFVIEQPNGSDWKPVLEEDVETTPEQNIIVMQFNIHEPGTYRVSFLNKNEVIEETEFEIK